MLTPINSQGMSMLSPPTFGASEGEEIPLSGTALNLYQQWQQQLQSLPEPVRRQILGQPSYSEGEVMPPGSGMAPSYDALSNEFGGMAGQMPREQQLLNELMSRRGFFQGDIPVGENNLNPWASRNPYAYGPGSLPQAQQRFPFGLY
jgi:hypothetical protein